jgi:hypothetical protein
MTSSGMFEQGSLQGKPKPDSTLGAALGDGPDGKGEYGLLPQAGARLQELRPSASSDTDGISGHPASLRPVGQEFAEQRCRRRFQLSDWHWHLGIIEGSVQQFVMQLSP